MPKRSDSPSGQDVSILYCLVGEALCLVQHLEDALCHSITLKKHVQKPGSMPQQDASKFLEKYRKLPFGPAISTARESNLYPTSLQSHLDNFLLERNWLVHESMNREDMFSEAGKVALFDRIKAAGKKANALQRAIEADLIQFSTAIGMDMSGVETAIKEYYQDI